MPRRFFKRVIPTQERLRNMRGLGFIGERLFDPSVWHLTRRSIRNAFVVGVFCAFLPIPFQMPLAAGVAIMARCNLPLAVSLVWITNPITIPAIFLATYSLGLWMLGRPAEVSEINLSLEWFTEELAAIGGPLLLGSLTCGIVFGLASGMAVDVFWRWHVVHRWRKRINPGARRLRGLGVPRGAPEKPQQ